MCDAYADERPKAEIQYGLLIGSGAGPVSLPHS